MADINTGAQEEKFIFGQNMEDRVVKPAGEEGALKDGQNGADAAPGDDTGQVTVPPGGDKPLLRPSAFSSPAHGQAVGGAMTNNPFAGRGAQGSYSDSDDEKREKPIVAPAHFTPVSNFGGRGFGFGARPSPNAKMLLRPSALDKQTANFNKENSSSTDFKTSFRLEPAKLQNPFLKADGNDQSDSPPKENTRPTEPKPEPAEAPPPEKPENNMSPNTGGTTTNAGATASTGNEAAPPANQSNSSSGFLFGQNMQNRATGGEAVVSQNSSGFLFGTKLEARVTSPTPPSVTTAAVTGDDADTDNNAAAAATADADTSAATDDGKPSSLVESAAAYEAKHCRPEYEEVEVRTGEEDESNVFQINVKLFLFDKGNQSWLERGRGQLRLNDRCFLNSRAFQSRLVMRTQGSLRVVLNTKIWAGMLVEMASEKTVRITAVDHDDGVKIYLIMASRSDATHIFSAINSRVQQLKAEGPSDGDTPGDAPATPGDAPALPADPPTTPDPRDLAASAQPEKRPVETASPEDRPLKRPKVARQKSDGQPRELTEESNDSSTVDPETEASNESCASSPTVKSSSSD